MARMMPMDRQRARPSTDLQHAMVNEPAEPNPFKEPRPASVGVDKFLAAGRQRNGVYTATQTGARQLADALQKQRTAQATQQIMDQLAKAKAAQYT